MNFNNFYYSEKYFLIYETTDCIKQLIGAIAKNFGDRSEGYGHWDIDHISYTNTKTYAAMHARHLTKTTKTNVYCAEPYAPILIVGHEHFGNEIFYHIIVEERIGWIYVRLDNDILPYPAAQLTR